MDEEEDLKKNFWSSWNRFWHYFNFSWPFPSWVPQLCSLINAIQLFSVLFGWFNSTNNTFIQSLYTISEFLTYLSFSKISNTIIFFFFFAIVQVFMFYIGFKYELLILNAIYVYILRFIVDIFLPIVSFKLFSTFAIAIQEYMNSELDFYFIILHSFSLIIYLTVFTIKTFSQSRIMILTTDFTQSWDLWIDYFKIIFASIMPVTKVIKDEKRMHDIYFCLCILYSIIFMYFDSNQAYVQPLMNIFFITVNISLFILSIINIEFYNLLEKNESIYLIIIALVLFFSFFISISYYNHKSAKYQKMFDAENDAQTFSDSLFDDPESVSILRQQSVHDPQRAAFFAEHLLNGTSDPFIYTESMRFLVLLQCMKEEVFEKIMKTDCNQFPILYRQLIYDAQTFVIAMDVSSGTVDPFLEDLNSIYLKIELLLIQLSEEIQLKNKERAIGLLSLYSKSCQHFEGTSLNAFRHSPNSPQLAELLRQYYLNLRGDYIQSQVWSHRESITDSSTNVSFHSYSSFRFPFSVYGSRVWNASTFVRSKDPMTHNKLKSQEAIEKVKSKAIVRVMIVFSIFSLLNLFVIFYKYQTYNFNFCFSKESVVVFQSLSSTLISPILNSAKFALNIIINGTTRYSKLNVPSSSLISYTVQNLTSFITAVSELKDTSSNEICAIWSNPQETVFSTNVSLQYLLLQINGLTKLIPNNLTTKEMSFFLVNFFHIYYSTYLPIDKLRLMVYKFIENLRDKQCKFSILFASVCFSIEVVVILLILFFMIHTTSDEKNKFWSIILEVDDKSIVSFQESLRDDYINKVNQSSNKRVGKVNSEEIDIINDETFSFPSTSTVINENELKQAVKKEKPTNLIILSFLFLFCLVCSHVLYIFLSLKVVNSSMRCNKSLDNMNVALINVSNSATECAAILACGIESDDSKILKKFLVKNSRHLDRNGIKLIDDEIVDLADSIDVVYDYVFSNLTRWFDGGYRFDSYFESILDSALNISNPILFKIEELRFNRFEYYKNLRNSISLLFSLFVFFIYFVFSIYFIKLVFDYSSEFSFLKSLLIILPSPYLSTISNLISLFSPENSSEDKSIDSLKLRSRYILKQSVDPIIIVDSNKKIMDLNEATEILTGMKKDELIGQEIKKIINQEDNENNSLTNESSEDKESVEFFRNLVFFNDQNVSISNSKKFNLHVIKSNGSLIPVSCTLINIQNHDDDESNSNILLSSSNSILQDQNFSKFTLSTSISYSSFTKEEATPAFAMVLCDRTAFTEQEDKLKTKKKEVEDLLDRVLPRVMAKKLSSGNQKLHSKIEKATIMFIGIVNILPWIRKHNPTEIMEQLDAICSIFDQNMANFPSLVKLKVINGTYMAAAGLFNETYDKPPPVEAVEFALLCAQSIANKNAITNKSIQSSSNPSKISPVSSATSLTAFNYPIPSPVPNLSMNISPGAVINKSSSGSSQIDDLQQQQQQSNQNSIFKSKPPLPPLPPSQQQQQQMQQQIQQQQYASAASAPLNIKLMIGINTGPIIAGILGSDKPVFDVWGDAVNVSARLETSCPCNHIQMSKETMEYLKKGDFDIKMRKGVYLKGKGYTNTYTISFEDIMNGENVITFKYENEDE